MSRRRLSPAGRAGFSLIETLIAIALLAGFLAAAVTILFQVSSAWATQADDPVADRHAEGLERFLRVVLSESGYAGISAPGAAQVADERAFLAVAPPGNLPVFDGPATVGGAIEARLATGADGGLLLFWNTAGERARGSLRPHRTTLSPWVVAAKIFVFDAANSKWTEFVPGGDASAGFGAAGDLRVLRLELDHRGQRRVIEIPLPRSGS